MVCKDSNNDNEPFDVDAFHDPFHKGEYDHFQWYLERCSIEKHAASKKKDDFEREKVENIVKEKEARSISEIRRYGRELFKQLRLNEYTFIGRTREIFIHSPRILESGEIDDSFNEVVWELLGDPSLWPNEPECVSITRVSELSRSPCPDPDHLGKPFVVLLVVSRNLRRDRNREYCANRSAAASLV